MKLQLIVDGITPNTMPNYNITDINTIEQAAYPAQVTEIYGPTVLNYIPITEVSMFLNKCKKLLSNGGRLIIGGVDAYLLSKQVSARVLTEKQYNELLFNDPKFKAVHSLQAVKALIQSLGFRVDLIHLEEDEVRFSLEVIK